MGNFFVNDKPKGKRPAEPPKGQGGIVPRGALVDVLMPKKTAKEILYQQIKTLLMEATEDIVGAKYLYATAKINRALGITEALKEGGVNNG